MNAPNLNSIPVPGGSLNLNFLSMSSQRVPTPAMRRTGEVRMRITIPKKRAVYSLIINRVLDIPEKGTPLKVWIASDGDGNVLTSIL